MLRSFKLRKLAALGLRGLAGGSMPERKVAVLGAAGGIGQPLSLLMKAPILISIFVFLIGLLR